MALGVVSVFGGGILNLLPIRPAGLYPATMLTDAVGATMAVLVLGYAIETRGKLRVPPWVSAGIAVAAFYGAVTLNSTEGVVSQLGDIRTRSLYLIFAVYGYVATRDREDAAWLLRWVLLLGSGVALVGILQAVLRSKLPGWLLVAQGEEVFGYAETEIVRANGLVGNTIVFSALMLMMFCVSWARFVVLPSWRDGLLCVVFASAVFASYSRMSISCLLASAVVLPLLHSFRHGRSSRGVRVLGYLVVTGVAGFLVAEVAGGLSGAIRDTFLVGGVFGNSNSSVIGSTEAHFEQIVSAQSYLARSPWIGVGMGTQRPGSFWAETNGIVTDGAVWLLLVESGAIGLVITLCFVAFGLKALWRVGPGSNGVGALASALLVFFGLQYGVASWINSAAMGKAVVVSGATLFGVVVSASRWNRLGPSLLGSSSPVDERNHRALGRMAKAQSGGIGREGSRTRHGNGTRFSATS